MAGLLQNLTYLTEAQGRNLEQYKAQPRFNVLVTAFMAECQAVENALWATLVGRLINNAPTGDLLAKLGKLVGQTATYGFTDAIYLLLISARIAVNRSNGLRQDMINIAGYLTPSSTIFCKDFGGNGGAAFYVAPQGPINTGLSPYIQVQQFLGPALSAGVLLMFVWSWVALSSTIVGGSIYNAGFAAGPPATNTGAGAGQKPGSIYNAGFVAGPPCQNDGGGKLVGVVEILGGST